ncbi:MAG: hypothetical protein IH899_05235, partial [Planctomycetes bacterium]|nr:hypothetical protein [Planctomycetota bacterium]
MLTIAIPQTDIPLFNGDGLNVTINGQPTVLRREGEYLCYGEHRCKILDEYVDGENVEFLAGSYGESEIELNKHQMSQQDFVDNAIHALLEELAGKELEWDISLPHTLLDCIAEDFENRGIMTEMELYPYIDWD